MGITQKSVKTLLLFVVMIVFSASFRMLFTDTYHVDTISTYFLLLLGVVFYLYVDWVIAQGHIKNNLKICAGLVLMVLIIRGARYGAFWELDQLMRYLWYIYYIPCLCAPYFSLRAATAIGMPDTQKMPKWLLFPAGISLVLTVFVLTNDLHQMVFHLHDGYQIYWKDEYTYGFLAYIVFAWEIIMMLISFAFMIYKCRVSTSKKYIWVPLLPATLGMIWLLLIAVELVPKIDGMYPLEFPETYGFSIAATWICGIQIGLVPANKSYQDLFHLSSIGAKIADKNGTIVYCSQNAINNLEEINRIEMGKSDFLIRTKEILGGFVSWQSDVGELNRTNQQLEVIAQKLQEENEFLRLENELKEERATLDAKSKLYDAIAVRVFNHSVKISELSGKNVASETINQRELKLICVYGSYIKRMANLMLLETQGPRINEMELALSIGESLRQLSKLGISTSIYTQEDFQSYPSHIIVNTYELFEQYMEQTLPYLLGILVTIKPGICKITLEVSSPVELSETVRSTIEWDEDTCFIGISLSEGGDQL